MKLIERWWPEGLVVVGAVLLVGWPGLFMALGVSGVVNRFNRRLALIESTLAKLHRSVDSIDGAIPNRDIHGDIITN